VYITFEALQMFLFLKKYECKILLKAHPLEYINYNFPGRISKAGWYFSPYCISLYLKKQFYLHKLYKPESNIDFR
jgi:hypothetical protein